MNTEYTTYVRTYSAYMPTGFQSSRGLTPLNCVSEPHFQHIITRAGHFPSVEADTQLTLLQCLTQFTSSILNPLS